MYFFWGSYFLDNWFLAYFNILIVFVSPTVFPIWPELNPHHCWHVHLSLTSFFIVPRYSHSVYNSYIFQTVLLFVSRGGLFIMTTSSQCLVRRNSPSRGGLFVCLFSWTNTTCIERLPMTSVAPARHKKGPPYCQLLFLKLSIVWQFSIKFLDHCHWTGFIELVEMYFIILGMNFTMLLYYPWKCSKGSST